MSPRTPGRRPDRYDEEYDRGKVKKVKNVKQGSGKDLGARRSVFQRAISKSRSRHSGGGGRDRGKGGAYSGQRGRERSPHHSGKKRSHRH